MDKRKSLLNISVSMGFNVISLIMGIVVKRFLIQACGNDVNGLNAMYLSIIGILSVAELGIGSAISFCMYKPIVEKNHAQVSALYHLFRKLYLMIGGFVLASGLVITPFIKVFAKDYAELNVNLYVTFILMLISTVITYLFGAKTALINAYKNNYITSAITYGGIVFQYILQTIVLLFTHSFILYLTCKIAGSVVQWLVTNIVTRKKYFAITSDRQNVDAETKIGLLRSIKAMFMHKIGNVLVNTVDSVVISSFVGVIALGEYSNYTIILTSVSSIIKLIFVSIISVLGHLYVENNKEISKKYCDLLHYVNFLVGFIFYLGYYAIIDNLIAILFDADLVVEKVISFVITLNGFIQFMRQNVLSFRDATGTFYNDRWKPLIEGVVNIVFSIAFVFKFGVVGVIMATIMTNLLICHIIEPYVLYKNAFQISPKRYYLRNYVMIVVFVVALIALDACLLNFENWFVGLVVNGFISVGFSAIVGVVTICISKEFRSAVIRFFKEIKSRRSVR